MNIIQLEEVINIVKNSYYNSNTNSTLYTICDIKYNIDVVLIASSLTKAYIKFYKLFKQHNNILIINNNEEYNKIILDNQIISNISYLYKKYIFGLITNWKTIKNFITLYKWLLIIINLIKTYKIHISIKSYIKLYRIIVKLHFICKGLQQLTVIPSYIFIVDLKPTSNILKEILLKNKYLICINTETYLLQKSYIPIIGFVNKIILTLTLYLINIAYIQSKI